MPFVTLPDARSDSAPAFTDLASLHRWLKALPQTQPLLLLSALREQVHAVDASLAPPGEIIARHAFVNRLEQIQSTLDLARPEASAGFFGSLDF